MILQKVSTRRVDRVAGCFAIFDARQPKSSKNVINLKDVLGKKPVGLNLATRALYESRVYGPVIDVVEQVESETEDGVAVILNEIYNEGHANKGVRPQLTDFALQIEPRTFLIGKDGPIKQRIEGAYCVTESREAHQTLRDSS